MNPQPLIMSDYFQKKERRGAQLNIRMPVSLKAELKELSDIWTDIAKESTGDDEVEVSMADVALPMLRRGIRKAWLKAGGKPKTAEDLKRAKKHLAAAKAEEDREDEEDEASDE